MNKKIIAVELLAVTAIEHLPDSRKARLDILGAVLDSLPEKSPVRIGAVHLLQLMLKEDKEQSALLLDYATRKVGAMK
jgi:hypothetical protein